MIQPVVGFGTELNAVIFGDRKIHEHRQIVILEARSVKQTARFLRETLTVGADAAGVAAKDALKELLAQKLGESQGDGK